MKVATRTEHKPQLELPPVSTWRTRSAPLVLIALLILLFIVMFIAVSFGSTAISIGTVIQVLLNSTHIFSFARHWDASTEVIILQVRMPVVVGAALVGAALSVAGVLFQGMLRNPLADPYLIGTSSGAALGAAIAFILPFDTLYGIAFPVTPILAFVGAMVTVLFVYLIARVDGRTPVVTLLLAGVVVNAVLIAFQTLVLTLVPHAQFTIQSLFNWLAGGVEVNNWSQVAVVAGIVLLGMIFAQSCARTLDVFALGEESASYLGLRVEQLKLLIVLVGSLLTAAAVSISGLIGFVGLVVPHAMRLLLGPKHCFLIPASALAGAIFLMLADLFSRVAFAPSVLPVGIFTALVGAPFFLFLLRNSKRDYQW